MPHPKPIFYQLTQAERRADLYIFGNITSCPVVPSETSAWNLSQQLAALDADEILVHINSYGGEVAEGLAIYNTLRASGATVATICEGFACSIASVIFMAGQTRIMRPASLLMIHSASSGSYGTAADHRKAADDLDTISAQSLAVYTEVTGQSANSILAMMEAETWISPEDALTLGFATAIADGQTSGNPTQSAQRCVFERLTAARRPAPSADTKTLNQFFAALAARKE